MTYLNLNLSEVLSRGERAEVGELIFDKSLTQSLIDSGDNTCFTISCRRPLASETGRNLK